MKKIMMMALMAVVIAAGASAQSTKELIKQQKEVKNELRKNLDVKPSKDMKKMANQLKKEKWLVPAGERSIEQQLMEAELLRAEPMLDMEGNLTSRYLLHTAQSTAGTYNAAYAAARNNAIVEIGSMLETEVAAAVQAKLDNDQTDATHALTVDKINQRVRTIVHQSLSNSRPVVALYRVLPNGNFQVQVNVGFDKQEIIKRMKKELRQQLEMEGDGLIDNIFENTGI